MTNKTTLLLTKSEYLRIQGRCEGGEDHLSSFYASAISLFLFGAILSESRIHEKPEEVYICAGEKVPVAVCRIFLC